MLFKRLERLKITKTNMVTFKLRRAAVSKEHVIGGMRRHQVNVGLHLLLVKVLLRRVLHRRPLNPVRNFTRPRVVLHSRRRRRKLLRSELHRDRGGWVKLLRDGGIYFGRSKPNLYDRRRLPVV